jgi:hypothetical protein
MPKPASAMTLSRLTHGGKVHSFVDVHNVLNADASRAIYKNSTSESAGASMLEASRTEWDR